MLKRRVGLARPFEGEAFLFEIKFAFNAPACFVGDDPILQQAVDVFALGGDQIGAQLCRRSNRLAPIRLSCHLPGPMVVPRTQDREHVGIGVAVSGKSIELALRHLQSFEPRRNFGILLAATGPGRPG